jgi:hypothetical protein
MTAAAAAQSGGAVLRIACADSDEGAAVRINGVFKGECPVDVQLRAGPAKIEVRKGDGDRERLFTKELNLADGTVKRIDVVLGEPVLTAQGAQREAERLRLAQAQAHREQEEKQAREREQQQRIVALLERQRSGAEAGDVPSMVAMGDRYWNGVEVAVDTAQALAWYRRAAQAGSEVAAYKAYTLQNRAGKKYSFHELAVKILSGPRQAARTVNLSGKDATRQFLLSDAFFSAPPATQPEMVNFKWDRFGTQFKNICTVGEGQRLCEMIGPNDSAKQKARLGGLAMVETVPAGFFGGQGLYADGLASVFGAPFPVSAAAPFGFDISHSSASGSYAAAWRCGWRAQRNDAGRDVLDCIVNSGSMYFLHTFVWLPNVGHFIEIRVVIE